MDIMIEGSRSASVAGLLHEKEIPFSVAIGDVSLMLERENSIQSLAMGNCINKNRRHSQGRPNVPKRMDWKGYHRLDVIYEYLDNLVKEFPSLCSVQVIGKSAEGRDLKLLKISNGNPENEGVWLDGAIHAREWISTAVVTYIADRIARQFSSHTESVTRKDWYILPVLNPDGYEYTHTNDRMWRKNRRRYGECVGVDLNRNFSHGWGAVGEEGSSDDPGSIFFRGSEPFSEPETAAVRNVITESTTKFKVFLSCHSYGEVIIFPWGYTAEPCPDYVDLLQGGSVMAKAIHKVDGHTYKVGSTKDLMYYSAGTSIDWGYGVAKIPYCYMLELRGKKHRFLLPKEDIVVTAKEVYSGVLQLLQFLNDNSEEQMNKSRACHCQYIS